MKQPKGYSDGFEREREQALSSNCYFKGVNAIFGSLWNKKVLV